MPIAFSLGLASTFFLFFSGTRIPPLILMTQMYGGIDSFALLALPMFVLTGELLNRLNLTERLIEVARLLVGWIKGGLAHVNVVYKHVFCWHLGLGFGGCCVDWADSHTSHDP